MPGSSFSCSCSASVRMSAIPVNTLAALFSILFSSDGWAGPPAGFGVAAGLVAGFATGLKFLGVAALGLLAVTIFLAAVFLATAFLLAAFFLLEAFDVLAAFAAAFLRAFFAIAVTRGSRRIIA